MSIDVRVTHRFDLLWEVDERGHPVVSMVSAADNDKTFGELHLTRELMISDFDPEDEDDREDAAALLHWLENTASALREQMDMHE